MGGAVEPVLGAAVARPTSKSSDAAEPLLGEATRIAWPTLKADDPAFAHLPWLAAAGGSEKPWRLLSILTPGRASGGALASRAGTGRGSLQLKRAARRVREGARRRRPARPAGGARRLLQSLSEEPPLDPVVKLACSPDDYLRQTATRLLARKASLEHIADLAKSPDAAVRLAAALAAGVRLTVPPGDFTPPESVKLTYPAEGAFFKTKIRYADGEADMRSMGRIGSFTIAEYWKAIEPNAEQKELFGLLQKMLDDPADPVRLQAAYYLSLLRDPKTEPAVARVFRSVQEGRLAAAPLHEVGKAWAIGPFADGEKGFQTPHPPEQGAVDLAAEYAGSGWQADVAGDEGGGRPIHLAAAADGVSAYVFFRLQSGSRQPVLLLTGSDRGPEGVAQRPARRRNARSHANPARIPSCWTPSRGATTCWCACS